MLSSDGNFEILLAVYDGETVNNMTECLRSLEVATKNIPCSLIIVIDGPIRSELLELITSFADNSRLMTKVVKSPRQLGLAAALNVGLQYCVSELVARMDSDDVCCANRFILQESFMRDNPEIHVLGGQIHEFDSDSAVIHTPHKLPQSDVEIKNYMRFRNPLRHPTVMFRRTAVMSVGGYPDVYPEDYLLWAKMWLAGFNFHNLSEILVKMRVGRNFYGRRNKKFLFGELKLYAYLYEVGAISIFNFVIFCVMRSLLRLAPVSIVSLIYKKMR